MTSMPARPWFGVRCVFRVRKGLYEERIVVTQAADLDDAILKAETEGDAYAELLDMRRLGFAQAYQMGGSLQNAAAAIAAEEGSDEDEPVEVFSLMRDSKLKPEKYLDRHFSTGGEHQRLV